MVPEGTLSEYLDSRRRMIDEALEAYFPAGGGPCASLHEAMRYSLFAGGKRLRPILCLAGAEAVHGVLGEVLPVACALECIHTYSLIHDDLPVMDDDDLRRGKPTSHKVFGEAAALLAGDGLLTEAFRLMATSPKAATGEDACRRLEVIGLIAEAAGCGGMVGGQIVDIESEGKPARLETVEFIHARKTGALITAAVVSGAILGGGDERQVAALRQYGRHLGLAFQISDDILDVEGDTAELGKTAGADLRKGKMTFPSAVGIDRAKQAQAQLAAEAIADLAGFDQAANPLRWIARYVIERRRLTHPWPRPPFWTESTTLQPSRS